MSVYDNLISILFKLPDGRSLEEYFKNVLVVGKFTQEEMKPGVTFSNMKKYASYDEVIQDFKPSSQIALEANAAFNQKNNNQTTSQIKYLIVAKQEENETVSEALSRAKTFDGKFAKVVPLSRALDDIKSTADWCVTNERFCDFVVTNVEDVSTIKGNNYAYAIFRKAAGDPIAAAIASTSTCGYFGAKDGSAQFTQLAGVIPEVYSGQEISDMKTANVAFYTNVSPIDGGKSDSFGYNWVIGSRMLGGELRQRQMIMHYIKKSMGLMALEFFNQKPVYDETGNNLLLSLAQKRFKSFQTYNLVIPTTSAQIGFSLKVEPIRTGKDSIMNTDTESYNAKKFKLSGYYYDSIVGEKADFLFYVDPSEEQIKQILGKDE